MGKHKIIKSAAAVALTASVVATAAPGASAASYKTNAKDQLVHTSTGKLVKGWKVFGGKLYKNGKLAPAKKYKIIGTGAAQKLFYGPTLKKGYKTANSKTLLFKDGKLADGWKQAGKNERLYKNGKLDKGYTVFTNVEGDKFLYQNGKLKKGQKTATRGGETLLFVDGKLAKGYVLHEASKTLFNNGKVAEGLVKYPETDGKYYNNGKLADGEINGVTYKDGVIVAKDVASVKAINDTTVEVTFKEAQKAENIKAADFKIEGLTVSNAALKQTDSKVVVLTTSKQEAGKEYTITYKENDTKTFVGFNAAIPTAIKSTEVKPYQTSQQAKIGTQVTVKATVTVAEGANKAGIPVTFVVDNNKDTATGNNANQGKDQTVEVLTDENGVASYTYTQYAASIDSVTAYATGAPTQRTSTVVYWDIVQPLEVTDVTPETSVVNGNKKVYKVATTKYNTEGTGANAKKYVNVTFAENYNVTPDKVNNSANVNDDKVSPFQSSVSGKDLATKVVKVYLNDKNEATFTVSGTNTTVTPVVFVDDQVKDQVGYERLNQTELQATASTVTFAAAANVVLTNEAQGKQYASAAKDVKAFDVTNDKGEKIMAANQGGRSYVATVKDKDGKAASADTEVYLTFKGGKNTNPAYDNANDGLHVYDVNGKEVKAVDVKDNKGTVIGSRYVLKTAKDGKVVYAVASEKANSYATPVITLVDSSVSEEGETTYFGDATVATAEFKVNNNNAKDGVVVKYTKAVEVTYQTVDQNGFPYAPKDATDVTFNFDTTFGKLTVGNETVAQAAGAGNKSLQLKTDDKGQIIFTLTTTVDTTANITASGNLVDVSNAKAKIVFENTGKAPVATVTTAELAAVQAAGSASEIETALKDNDAFKTLKPAERTAFAEAVLKDLKAGKVFTVAQLSDKLAEAVKASQPEQPTTPEVTATAKAYTEAVAAIPALKEDKSNKAEVEAAIVKAEEAAKALTEADKATTAVKDADKGLAVAKEGVKGETPVETAKTVAELVAAGAVEVKSSIGGPLVRIVDKTKLPTEELKNAENFTLVFEDDSKLTIDKTTTSGIQYVTVTDKTTEQVNKATLTVTAK